MPSAGSMRLFETGMELVRAELAVAMARARQVVLRAVTALLATILAGALLQVALVICILSPLLVRTLPSDSIWMAVALPCVLALGSLVAAGLAWGGLGRILGRGGPSTAPGPDGSTSKDSSQPRLASLEEESVRQ